MAKRFIDTQKYHKPFIRSLPGAYKLLWDFILCECDHAGIWIVDFEIARIYLGSDMIIDKDEALRLFNADEKRIVEIDSGKKWFISSFIDFQYGKLNIENRAHNSVIHQLEKYNLKINKPLRSPLQGAKDKDKDKDKDMNKDIFDLARKFYPGTKRGLDTEFKNFIKHSDWKICMPLLYPAIEKQKKFRNKLFSESKFIPEWKHFKTWINQRCWEDELNEINYQKVSNNRGIPMTQKEMIEKQKMRQHLGF